MSKYSVSKKHHEAIDALAQAIDAANLGDVPNMAEGIFSILVMNGWRVAKSKDVRSETEDYKW